MISQSVSFSNIISLIKKSESAATAKIELVKQYNFTENQANAIVEMKLDKLAGLEKIEINKEKQELISQIEALTLILQDVQSELIKRLKHLVSIYGDERRTEITQISDSTKEEKEIEFVEPEKCVVVLTESGLVKRVPVTSFRTQKRNGKGVRTQDDITSMVIRTNTIDSLMIFTDKGKMYRLLVNDIPVGNNTSKGQSIKSLVTMEIDENPTVIYSIYRDTDAKYVLFTTKNGLIKKTALEEYIKTSKKNGIAAITIKEDDELVSVNLIKDEDVIVLTKNGYSIRFNSNEVGITSRATSGVKAIGLNEEDEVVTTLPIRDEKDNLAIFAENGLGKRIELKEFPKQKRAGKGVICYKVSDSTGKIAAATLVSDEDDILICGNKTSLCISAQDLPVLGRTSIGNQMIKDNKIQSVSKVN